MNILLSNDDGVYAPGIRFLYEELSKIAKVTVIAPEVDKSASGKSLTINSPLLPRYLDNGFIAVNGTPTDCVHLGLTELLDEKPDLVVAGINAGANLGDDVLYSGTVAAATEGFLFGYPAMAFSLTGKLSSESYFKAATYAKDIVNYYSKQQIAKNSVLNINFPCFETNHIAKGIEISRLGQRHKAEGMVKLKDPHDRTVYWLGKLGATQDAGKGTDFYAVESGKISITPLQMDLTCYKTLDSISDWLKEFNFTC